MIYIDLDGVLADLEAYMIQKSPAAAEREFDFFGLAFSDKRFFLDSPVIESGYELLEEIRSQGRDYRILSSLPCLGRFYEHALKHYYAPDKVQKIYAQFADNKIEWCKRLGIPAENVILVNSTSEKIRYCQSPEDILYDDREAICKEWIAKGGQAKLVAYESRRQEYIGESK